MKGPRNETDWLKSHDKLKGEMSLEPTTAVSFLEFFPYPIRQMHNVVGKRK